MRRVIFAVLAVVSLIVGGSASAAAAAGVTVLDRCIVGQGGSICGAEFLRQESIKEMRACADVLRQIAGLLDTERQAVAATAPRDSRSGSATVAIQKQYFDATTSAMARVLGRVQNAHECRVGNSLRP